MGDTDTDAAKCGICRSPVESSGWCGNCLTFPLNVTPIRYCGTCNRLVPPSGLCRQCQTYTRSELTPARFDWQDTRTVPRLVSRGENANRMRLLGSVIDGDVPRATLLERMEAMERVEPGVGWHEGAESLRAHTTGINQRFSSRHLRTHGLVVGKTPMGDPIVRYGQAVTLPEEPPF